MDHVIYQLKHHPLTLASPKKAEKQTSSSFQEMLEKESGLKVSKHAEKRLRDRSIELQDEKWNLIHHKVQEAKQKGLDETLVLSKEAALIISAKNSTVITAMDRKEASSQIFTNINGTIIID